MATECFSGRLEIFELLEICKESQVKGRAVKSPPAFIEIKEVFEDISLSRIVKVIPQIVLSGKGIVEPGYPRVGSRVGKEILDK